MPEEHFQILSTAIWQEMRKGVKERNRESERVKSLAAHPCAPVNIKSKRFISEHHQTHFQQ